MSRPNPAKLPDKEGIYWLKINYESGQNEWVIGEIYDLEAPVKYFMIGGDSSVLWNSRYCVVVEVGPEIIAPDKQIIIEPGMLIEEYNDI